MNGNVDNMGRAIMPLSVHASINQDAIQLNAWVDTALTGDLVVPREMVEQLGLPQSAAITAGLADGTQVVLETYTCVVEWFGGQRIVEVVANEGQVPLLGIGLLQNRKLEVDYRQQTVSIE